MPGFQTLPFWHWLLQWSGVCRRHVLAFPHLYPQGAFSQYNSIVFSQFLVFVRQNQGKERKAKIPLCLSNFPEPSLVHEENKPQRWVICSQRVSPVLRIGLSFMSQVCTEWSREMLCSPDSPVRQSSFVHGLGQTASFCPLCFSLSPQCCSFMPQLWLTVKYPHSACKGKVWPWCHWYPNA